MHPTATIVNMCLRVRTGGTALMYRVSIISRMGQVPWALTWEERAKRAAVPTWLLSALLCLCAWLLLISGFAVKAALK